MGGGLHNKGQNFAYAHLIDTSQPWYKNGGIRKLNGWVLVLLIMGCIDGFDGSAMGAFRSLPFWNNYFEHPKGGRLGLLLAISNIGQLIGLPVSPYFMDKFGRRTSVAVGTAIMILSSVIQACSQRLEVFMVSRFFFGFSMPFAHATPLLVAEIAFPTQRAIATSLIGPCAHFGGVMSSWIMLGILRIQSTWGWRGLSIIQAVPAVFVFICLYWCPESPRWLMSKGRDGDARRFLATYHGNGDENHPLVLVELDEMRQTIKEEQAKKKDGWLSFFRTGGNLRRLRMIVFMAFANPFSGHALLGHYLKEVLVSVGIRDHKEQLLINGGLHTWNFIIGFGAALFVERAGRRKMFLLAIFGMLTIWLFLTTTFGLYQEQDNMDAGHAFVGLIFVFQGFHNLAFAPLLGTYLIEILPYSLRAKGMTLYSFFGAIFRCFNTYVNPILLKALQWKYFIVYIVLLAFIAAFLWLFLVETRGRTLEETAALFDKEIKNVAEPPVEEVAEVLPGEETSERKVHFDSRPQSFVISDEPPNSSSMREVEISPDYRFPQRPPSVHSNGTFDSRTDLIRK